MKDEELRKAISVTLEDESGREFVGKVQRVEGGNVTIKTNVGSGGYVDHVVKNAKVKNVDEFVKFQK